MSEPFKPAPDVSLDKVEWRVDSQPFDRSGGTACRWVPYVNAPIVARLLDEWVGPDGWSDSYETVTIAGKEALWCHLTIGGVTKSDVGVASNTEAQKGMVSDAFKRAACLKWGAGRNVYDLPTLWATCGVRESGGKRYAKESPDTIPDLLRQLKQRGYEVEGLTRASGDDSDLNAAADAPAPNAPAASPETLRTLRDALKALGHYPDAYKERAFPMISVLDRMLDGEEVPMPAADAHDAIALLGEASTVGESMPDAHGASPEPQVGPSTTTTGDASPAVDDPALAEAEALATAPCSLCGSTRTKRAVIGERVRCVDAAGCEKRVAAAADGTCKTPDCDATEKLDDQGYCPAHEQF